VPAKMETVNVLSHLTLYRNGGIFCMLAGSLEWGASILGAIRSVPWGCGRKINHIGLAPI
jgi:hypothetical protein